jgi:hypothetical protein
MSFYLLDNFAVLFLLFACLLYSVKLAHVSIRLQYMQRNSKPTPKVLSRKHNSWRKELLKGWHLEGGPVE